MFSLDRLVPRTNFKKSLETAAKDLSANTVAEGALVVPVVEECSVARQKRYWLATGQKYARQEHWAKLSAMIEKADHELQRTGDGTLVAELLAQGARNDVIGAFDHVLANQAEDPDAPLLDGITALEAELSEHSGGYGMAVIVALTHLEIAWIWRGKTSLSRVPQNRLRASATHMNRAKEIFDTRCAYQKGSALCALLQARLAARPDHSSSRTLASLTAAYPAYFDINPRACDQMRAFGVALLPSWHGDHERIEAEAKNAANALSTAWGDGAYTWIMMDAITQDADALAALDTDRFISGLRDILERTDNQATVNLFAAYCAVTMSEDTGNNAADLNSARIHQCRNWVIREYLREVHPQIWARATRGFDSSLQIVCNKRFSKHGLGEAQRVLKAQFLRELARGQNVNFSANGPVVSNGNMNPSLA